MSDFESGVSVKMRTKMLSHTYTPSRYEAAGNSYGPSGPQQSAISLIQPLAQLSRNYHHQRMSSPSFCDIFSFVLNAPIRAERRIDFFLNQDSLLIVVSETNHSPL